MEFTKRWAVASALAAATACTTWADDQNPPLSPNAVPPSIIAAGDKDKIPLLMLKLYKLNEAKYDKTLGIENAAPKEADPKDKKEMYVEYTDADKIKACCKDFGVDPKGVSKIIVSGDDVEQQYKFLKEDKKVKATAATTRYEYKPKNSTEAVNKELIEAQKQITRTFATTHLVDENKVLFRYAEKKTGETKPTKWNTLEVKFNADKAVFSATHSGQDVQEPKEVGVYPLAEVEKNLSYRNASAPPAPPKVGMGGR